MPNLYNSITQMCAYTMLVLFLSGCKSTHHPNLVGTVWMQTAAEYRASAMQTYLAAMANLQTATVDNSWSAALEQKGNYGDLPPAVIFDIDETVLDNSSYQAWLIHNNVRYDPKSWDAWVGQRQARAIPGAVNFINSLTENNITSIYITNRTCRKRNNEREVCPQKRDTIENLRAVGIKNVEMKNVLLKGEVVDWRAEKQSRRQYIVKHFRILMMFGDDLGDFIANVKEDITYVERNKLVGRYRQKWGKQWFMLSNPLYGSWERVLNRPKKQYLRL